VGYTWQEALGVSEKGGLTFEDDSRSVAGADPVAGGDLRRRRGEACSDRDAIVNGIAHAVYRLAYGNLGGDAKSRFPDTTAASLCA